MKESLPKFACFLSGEGASAPGGDILEKKNIILNCQSVTPGEAIRACGRLLMANATAEDLFQTLNGLT